jgi:hypothetical protein
MLYPELEQELQESKHALYRATSQNIIEHCKHRLALLDNYRSKLYELQVTHGSDQASASTTVREVPDRNVIREAIEKTTQEKNRTQILLLSFTTVSGYEAVEVFNRRKYEGHEDWELRSSGVKFPGGGDADLMTIQEAVDLASLLRREDYLVNRQGEVRSDSGDELAKPFPHSGV